MDAFRRVRKYYGRERARDILHYLQMITIGNLAGNTLDAFPMMQGYCEYYRGDHKGKR